jgi:hypothetical protein
MIKWLLIATALAIVPVWQADTGDAIRDRLDAYLIAYEPRLSTLIADEQLLQRDGAARDADFRNRSGTSENRRIISEVAFIGLPGDAGWLGFRRVTTVNGKTVKDRGTPLSALLTEGASDDYDQARLLLADSARHNLGSPRTTNLPNLPLEFLHPRNRHRLHHRVSGVERIRGVQTTRLIFEEHSTPTIITRPDGGDMSSLITAWVETTTGQLLRAEVKTRDARIGVLPFDNVIWVDFRPDEKLGLLVPYEMTETFFAGRFREGTGTAKYTNYRQFTTGARVITPKP